jgi:NAD(P)-dependent dehydrogenase (short-subunit alcohol dehydrogenase family)
MLPRTSLSGATANAATRSTMTRSTRTLPQSTTASAAPFVCLPVLVRHAPVQSAAASGFRQANRVRPPARVPRRFTARAATKHGVIGLTRSAALEYAPRGIRINAVCPGTIDTPMVAAMLEGQADAMKERMRDQQPIGRMGSSDEIAAAVLWLCSPGASFVIGVALPVDGGFTAR